jgi:hypothetical protein
VALLPVLGWTALGALLDAGAGARLWRTCAAVAVCLAGVLASGTAPGLVAVAIIALVLGACVAAAGSPSGRRARAFAAAHRGAVVAGLALAVAGAAAWSHGWRAADVEAVFHREPLFGAAAAVIDRQPAGTRVAVFGDQWVYPAFGARHHLQPVRTDGEGRVAAAPIGAAMGPDGPTVHPSTLRSNLRSAGIGLVVVVHQPHPGRSPAMPGQDAALETVGDARLLYRDRAVAVWKLEP